MSNAMQPRGRGNASVLSSTLSPPWHGRWLERGCPADPISAPPPVLPCSVTARDVWQTGAVGCAQRGRAGVFECRPMALSQGPWVTSARDQCSPPTFPTQHTLLGCQQPQAPRSCASLPALRCVSDTEGVSNTTRNLNQDPSTFHTHPACGSPYFLNKR